MANIFQLCVCRVLNISNGGCLLPALNVLAEEDGDGMFAPLEVEIFLLCWGVAEVLLQAPPVARQHWHQHSDNQINIGFCEL